MKTAVKFESALKDHLADAEQAAKYLTACYEEGPEVFLRGVLMRQPKMEPFPPTATRERGGSMQARKWQQRELASKLQPM